MREAKVPTRKECLKMLEDQKLAKNSIEHIMLVNKIAVFIAEKLQDSGANIDVDLVDKASLLHDVARAVDYGRNTSMHPRVGAEIMLKKGYPEIAAIIRKHSITSLLTNELSKLQNELPKTWEEKVVFYADKRENDGQIVSIKEWLLGWKEMRDNPKEMDQCLEMLRAIEREIFDRLDFRPEQLKEIIKELISKD